MVGTVARLTASMNNLDLNKQATCSKYEIGRFCIYSILCQFRYTHTAGY